MSHEPQGDLARRLLAAAREDAPDEASLERALRRVAHPPAPQRVHWLVWALPAAAVVVGVVSLVLLRPADETVLALAEPLPKARPEDAPLRVARPRPEPPTPEPAAMPPRPVAVRPAPAPPPAAPGPKPSPKPVPAGACGCAPDDLMCAMRCGQTKKK